MFLRIAVGAHWLACVDVRQLWEDLAYLRRTRRAVRDRLHSEWKSEGKWRPRKWDPFLFTGGAGLGVYLLLSGDTFERVLGAGFLAAPIALTGITIWVYWKGLRLLRRERRPAP